MKTLEYQAFKKHILQYMTLDDLKDNLEHHTPAELVRDGFFDCYYAQVLDTLKDVYGDEYKQKTYLRKDGDMKFKNSEAYCWTVYVNKMAMAIKKMVEE